MSGAFTASHLQVPLLRSRRRSSRQAISLSSTRPRDHPSPKSTLQKISQSRLHFRSGIFLTRARNARGGSNGEEAEDDPKKEASKDMIEDAPTVISGASVVLADSIDLEGMSGMSQSPRNLDDEEEAVRPWKEDRLADIQSLKTSLLAMVAGYDRGSAAVGKDIAKIRSIVESLETLSGSVDLSGASKIQPNAEDVFDGTWKLIFTSSFQAGGRSPINVPAPLRLGGVYQVVDVEKRTLDNVVDTLISSVLRFPWTPSNAVPKIRATLKHDMSYSMSIVSITFKETIINILDAGFEIPKATLPSLSSAVRSLTGRKSDSEFTIVYLDNDLRITEGDRSELRIFVKIPGLD